MQTLYQNRKGDIEQRAEIVAAAAAAVSTKIISGLTYLFYFLLLL